MALTLCLRGHLYPFIVLIPRDEATRPAKRACIPNGPGISRAFTATLVYSFIVLTPWVSPRFIKGSVLTIPRKTKESQR